RPPQRALRPCGSREPRSRGESPLRGRFVARPPRGHPRGDYRLGPAVSRPVARRRRVPLRVRARRAGGAVPDDGSGLVPEQGLLRGCPQQPPRVDVEGGRRPRPGVLLPRGARARGGDGGTPPDTLLPCPRVRWPPPPPTFRA